MLDSALQSLAGAPLAVQVLVLLVVSLPACGLGAAVLLKVIDVLTGGGKDAPVRKGSHTSGTVEPKK